MEMRERSKSKSAASYSVQCHVTNRSASTAALVLGLRCLLLISYYLIPYRLCLCAYASNASTRLPVLNAGHSAVQKCSSQ